MVRLLTFAYGKKSDWDGKNPHCMSYGFSYRDYSLLNDGENFISIS